MYMSSALLNKNRIFLLKDKVEEEYMLLYDCVVYKLFVRIFVKVCNNVIYKASQELRNYAAKHFQYSPGRLYPHNTVHRNLQFTSTYIRNGFSLPPLPPPPQLFPHYTTIILLPFCLRYFLSLCYYSPSKKLLLPIFINLLYCEINAYILLSMEYKKQVPIHQIYIHMLLLIYNLPQQRLCGIVRVPGCGLRCEYNKAHMQLQICCVSFLLYGSWFMCGYLR